MQHQQQKIEYAFLAPSFSWYSSPDSKTSKAVAKVIREEDAARYHKQGDVDSDDFEFDLVLNDRAITGSLGKLFMAEREDSSSSSSSETNELGTKCKKNSSTGSGSKRWIFRFLLRRSNSECKGESRKQRRNSGEVRKVGGRWKAQTPVQQFYVQRRAENEFGKRKSYLPYRKDLVGKLLPF